MPVVIAHRMALEDLSIPGVPAFNPMMLLHGEETVEVFKQVEPDTKVLVQDTLVDLQDKKKATVIVIQTELRDEESGDLLAKILTNLFVRGIGGFGERGKIRTDYPKPPARAPDAVSEQTTTPNQAFIYRLSGDYNPLHVDP